MGRRQFEPRFVAIWIAVVLLFIGSTVVAPNSVQGTSVQAILPFVAFLAIASMGQAIVIMTGGIDLSIPAVITMVGAILLAVTKGSDSNTVLAVGIALAMAMAVGLGNGIMVAVFRLNALLVTMAVGTLVTGATLWYRTGLQQESQVPPALATWGAERVMGLSYSVWVALALMLLLTAGLYYTRIGRRFTAVGANPTAAWIAGIHVQGYQIGAYALAALLYAVTGILLSAFIRNPTLELGSPYLLAPIAAVVLGGASLSGGVGSMVATMGGALFLTQLGQVLRVMGLSSAVQFIIQGLAIAAGMALSNVRFWGMNGSTAIRMGKRLAAIGRVLGRGAGHADDT